MGNIKHISKLLILSIMLFGSLFFVFDKSILAACSASSCECCGTNPYTGLPGCQCIAKCNADPPFCSCSGCPAPPACRPSCSNYCGTKSDGCDGTCACVECGPTLGTWSACSDVTHTRTRTCAENCGTDNCTALGAVGGVITEVCIATINGTLFDASDMTYCPADIGTNPAYDSLRYTNQTFGLTGEWPVLSLPVSTDASGNYAETVYPSTTYPFYTYDYTDLIDSGKAAGVKFECQAAIAAAPEVGTVTKDTGFWRVYGGWWQVVGGNVHAEKGMKSSIPATLVPMESPYVNQRLIKPAVNGRVGVLSHGFVWQDSELGTNPDARVSDSLWRVESLYGGLRYDFNYYQTRMDIFPFTTWTGGDINYEDTMAKGYQIFKYLSGGEVIMNSLTLTPGQKAILLIKGNLTVTGDITVPEGAFLLVISNNTITFNTNVATAQGWFVAENIAVPCEDSAAPLGECDRTDIQFDGQGSFIGWTNISLGRDRFLENNDAPSEIFTYRADMRLNVPTPVKVYPGKYKPFIP